MHRRSRRSRHHSRWPVDGRLLSHSRGSMAELFYDKDADLGRLQDRRIAIIGYGSQGHAHALNLTESGLDVRVGLYPSSKSRAKAEAAGLRVASVADAARE